MGKFKRSNSSIINLRIFHNWVKNEMYKTAAFDLRENPDNEEVGLSILELAVGRAGDLYKWIGVDATEVVGVDIDDASVFGKDGAYHRYRRLRNKNQQDENDVPLCTFYVMDLSKPESFVKLKELLKTKKFDIVSCHFAFHYFFESQNAINNILSIVKYFMAPHGYFMITTMDGKNIKNVLGDKSKVDSESFAIEKRFDGKSVYGQQYAVSLGDKGEDHYFAQNASVEYLVDQTELEKKITEFGMETIALKGFNLWYNEYKTTREYRQLGSSEKEFSFFNFSAVYKMK